MSASGNSSTIGGDFLIAITSPMAMSTNPRPRYGPITAPSCPARTAAPGPESRLAMFTGSSSLGRISVAAKQHTDVRADGIERLGEVESSCRGLLRPQRQHVRVG